jgi:outer membrane protein OmpA-like peptidoglycan-associated protein
MKNIILIVLGVVLTAHSLLAQKNECHNSVVINIEDFKTAASVNKALVKLYLNDDFVANKYSDNSGTVQFNNLNCDSKYILKIIKENYLEDVKLVFTTTIDHYQHEVKVRLVPQKEFDITADGEKRIIADNIVFYPDSNELEPDSVKELRRILKILKKYDDLNIEIGFHTDSRGDENYIQKLTQKRAEVCKDFFVENGIDSDRIVAKGYGGSKPVNHCRKGVKCSEKEHRINHRSVFKVLSGG